MLPDGPRIKLRIVNNVCLPLLCFLSVVSQTTGAACYSSAQRQCLSNLTSLVMAANEPDIDSTAVCGTLDELIRCILPQMADCNYDEKKLFLEDIVYPHLEPPHNCHFNNETSSSAWTTIPNYSVIATSTLIYVGLVLLQLYYLIS